MPINLYPISVGKENKFSKTFRPLSSDKEGNRKIIFVENCEILGDKRISECFNE